MTNVTQMHFAQYDSYKKMQTKVLCNMLEGMCINMVVSDQMYHPVREAVSRLRDFDKAVRQLKEFYDEDKTSYITPGYAAALAFADNLLEEWIENE